MEKFIAVTAALAALGILGLVVYEQVESKRIDAMRPTTITCIEHRVGQTLRISD